MGGTRGSGILFSAGDVLEMSVERGVGGVYGMCMCLARGGMGGVGVRGLVLGFTNPGGTGEKCGLCFGCGWCWRGVGGLLGPGSGRVGWCLVRVCCKSGLFVLMAGPAICILC